MTQREAEYLSIIGENQMLNTVINNIDKEIASAVEQGYTALTTDEGFVRKLDRRERKRLKAFYKSLGYFRVRVHSRCIDLSWRK